MSSKIDFKEGVKFNEGVKIENGIDFARLHIISTQNNPKASLWARSYLYGKRAGSKPKANKPHMEPEKKGSDKWTVAAVLQDGSEALRKAARGASLYNNKMQLFQAGSYRRRCFVKIGYTNPGQKFSNRGRLGKFLQGTDIGTGAYNKGLIGYISREEATLDKKPQWENAEEKRSVYTCDDNGEIVQITTAEAVALLKDDPVFKVILSPEDGGVDIKKFAEKFMEAMENKLGVRLRWCAANHYNTDHPHVHILFSRKTKDGKLLRFNTKYIKKQLKKTAQDILTQIKGPVLWEEQLERIEKEAKSRGFCDIDKKILAMARTNPSDPTRLPIHRIKNSDALTYMQVSKRLRVLNRRHLVEFEKGDKEGPIKKEGAWVIKDDLEEKVRKDEFARELEIDTAGFVLDKDDKGYKCSVIKAKRPDEDKPRVLMALVDENGIKHLREEFIDEELGTELPQGVFELRNIKSLLVNKERTIND